MNVYNLIQLKMTFIKVHYLLEHELLVCFSTGVEHLNSTPYAGVFGI